MNKVRKILDGFGYAMMIALALFVLAVIVFSVGIVFYEEPENTVDEECCREYFIDYT